MKKTILLICLNLSVIILMGQNTEPKKPKSEQKYSPKPIEGLEDWLAWRKNTIGNIGQQPEGMVSTSRGMKHRLDSVINAGWNTTGGQWSKEDKLAYVYDAKGNIITELHYGLNTNQWEYSNKQEYVYDTNSNLTKETFFQWNVSQNTWAVQKQEENSYNSSNQLVKSIYSQSDGSGDLQPKIKGEYQYDNKGDLSMATFSYWDKIFNNDWETSNKEEYVYNNLGKPLLITYSDWSKSNQQWEITGKDEYTYNAKNDLTLFVYSTMDENPKWKFVDKKEYTFDGKGNLIVAIKYLWQNAQWQQSFKDEFSYDTKGNIILHSYANWSQNENDWEYGSKYEITYDDKGNVIVFLINNWIAANKKWEAFSKETRIYDNAVPFSELQLPFYLNTDSKIFSNKLLEITYSDFKNNSWVNQGKSTLLYSKSNISAIVTVSENEMKIFPNPTTSYINIQTQDKEGLIVFELLNLQGQQIMKQNITTNSHVDISFLPKGIYLCKVSNSDNNILIRKISLQ